MPANERPDTRYRPDIDGLRAIAITSVVLYHVGLPFTPSGFVGVDIFFVISGYLIGGIILRDAAQRSFSFLGFYARRARRILPALIAVVLFTCIAGCLLLDAQELRDLGTSAMSALAAISNIKFAQKAGYFAPEQHNDPLLMTWSLGVEEQFYVLFPLLLIVIARFSPKLRLAALSVLIVVSFAAGLWMFSRDPRSAFYLLPARAWELGAGALLAALHQRGDRSVAPGWFGEAKAWTGAALLIASIGLFDRYTPFPGWVAVLPVLGAFLLIDAEASIFNRRVLASRPFVFVGLISYSWYLWHWPLLAFVRVSSAWAPSLATNLEVGLLSFVIAVASWRYIERPFRNRALAPRAVLFRYACVLAVAFAPAVVFRATNGLPMRLSQAARRAEATAGEDIGACLRTFGDTTPDNSAACAPPADGRPAFALVGDSHAAALAPGLTALANEQNARLLRFAKGACSPLMGVSFAMPQHPGHDAECATFNQRVRDRIASDPSVGTVFIAALWIQGSWGRDLFYAPDGRRLDPAEAVRKGLPPLLDFFRAHGKQVVIFGDVPNFDFVAPQEKLNEAIPLRHLISAVSNGAAGIHDGLVDRAQITPRSFALNAVVQEISANRDGVTYVDLAAPLCSPAACWFESDGVLLYADDAHVSHEGALFVTAGLRQAVGRQARARGPQ